MALFCPSSRYTPALDLKLVYRDPIARAVPEREQSRGEEIANSIIHGIGLVTALAATPFLIIHAVQHGDTGFIVGVSLFAATMVLLYLASTLYHVLPQGKAKRVFKIIEHSAIFFLIAGTYTPFTLGVLRGPWAGHSLGPSGVLPQSG